MRNLSKSKLLAFRQCPKRMWLEIHEPKLREDSPHTEATFRTGHEVGDVARRLYDPKGKGALVDAQAEGYKEALARSGTLLETAQPVFEAGFSAEGAIAFADILLPVKRRGKLEWRMVEVKSSTSVKDYHRDDAAIQAFVARSTGLRLSSISLAHIDNTWVYPGKGDYDGLLVEQDLTQESFSREDEVKEWLNEAHAVAEQAKEPKKTTGAHCNTPFECGFASYCRSKEPQAKHPAEFLPRIGKKIRSYIDEEKVIELKQVPDELLNPLQLRVKQHTLSGKPYFDAKGAAAELARHKLPALFLDFETIYFAVPIWEGTRPYQQVPFQFSLHRLAKSGALEHSAFLSLDGLDPSKAFAQALVGACGKSEPVFVYNAGFEKARITELAARFPTLRKQLLAIAGRLVDLWPVAQNFYYHPSQEGSWSIKYVLPAVVPELRYDDLKEVQDGGMAMEAFTEAIHPQVTAERKARLEQALLEYCKLDTYAMVRIWQVFAGRKDLKL